MQRYSKIGYVVLFCAKKKSDDSFGLWSHRSLLLLFGVGGNKEVALTDLRGYLVEISQRNLADQVLVVGAYILLLN